MIKPNTNSIRAQIVKGTASSFIIQIGFAALSFITATVLARLLGVEGYGTYSNAVSWVLILSAVGVFGFNTILLRDLAIFKSQNNIALMRGLLRFSDGLILIISVFLMFILWGVAWIFFSTPDKENLRVSLFVGAPLIPLYTLINLRQFAMRGLQKVTRAMVPDLIIRPSLTLLCIIIISFFFPYLINVQFILFVSIIVALFVLFISMRWLQTLLPEEYRTTRPIYQINNWLKAAPPMFVIGGTGIIFAQVPTVLLGILSDVKNIGYFAVVSRVATLLIFLPMAVAIVMGPMIASLYSQQEKLRLQNIIKKINRLTFAITFIFGLIFFVFSKKLLSFFGNEFQIADKALLLLIIGYLVDSGLGMSIVTLMMTGFETVVAKYQIAFAVILVILCIILIPINGFESAALAFMIVMIISRFTFSLLAKKKTGINTTIF